MNQPEFQPPRLRERLSLGREGLLAALGLLTCFPVRTHLSATAPEEPPSGGGAAWARAGIWFPIVGLALGGLLAGSRAGLGLLFPPVVVASLIVALWAAVTGALHLDGLADSCDGLLAAAPRERRLEILRDPRVGSFGAAGLIIFLILKTAAVQSLGDQGLAALLLAPAIARFLVLLMARGPCARREGMAWELGHVVDKRVISIAALAPAVLVVFVLCMSRDGWGVALARAGLAVALAGLAAGGLVLFARRRLGGVTGDVLGAGVEICELAVLLAHCAGTP